MMNRDEGKNINNKQEKAQQAKTDLSADKTLSIPVIEEKVTVGKEKVESGKVRISKRVYEEEETLNLPESKEELDVERVKINKYVDSAPPAIRQEGDTTIIPVLKEVTVVEKRLVLVEEVRVTRRKVQSESSQKVNLRKEEIIVEREENKQYKERK